MQRLFFQRSQPLLRGVSRAGRYISPCAPPAPRICTVPRYTPVPAHTRQVSMAANIVLPQRAQWAQQHLTTIFQATDETSFGEAFDAFIAAQPTSIVVNGQPLSRDAYKAQIWRDKFLEAGAQVRFLGVNAVPSDPQQPVTVRPLPLSRIRDADGAHRPARSACSCRRRSTRRCSSWHWVCGAILLAVKMG